jgi:hypothetical protein
VKTREAIGIIGNGVGKDCDRDIALQLRIPRQIDLAHPSSAERGEDFVRAEASAGREARLLASLNHPHIAAIYGFEEATLRHTLCRASKSLAASEQPDV